MPKSHRSSATPIRQPDTHKPAVSSETCGEDEYVYQVDIKKHCRDYTTHAKRWDKSDETGGLFDLVCRGFDICKLEVMKGNKLTPVKPSPKEDRKE